ncbi:GNAT family N-acetyltransferase/peptidase C39 family protein [Gynuella sp.]|uniref:GNAT family N-acetyltransferase/peptidase C39 family protein n=1 Tax=Gynuella sp. TaxID=2969146 RepID=UPI003D0D92F9
MDAIRAADGSDITGLVRLENMVFDSDRLNARRFRYFLHNDKSELWVMGKPVSAYALVMFHRGTGLARLYSIAVHPDNRGQGIASLLLEHIEQRVLARTSLVLRLEVKVDNEAAIRLYQKRGYKKVADLSHYYEDGTDGLKMEKRLQPIVKVPENVCYYPQSTPFTCGPASLLMAMHSLKPTVTISAIEELNIWRESTTVYLTTGHGGTSPQGLALAAKIRGFDVELWLSSTEVPFLNSVRDAHKRQVITLVAEDFDRRCQQQGIIPQPFPASLDKIEETLRDGGRILLLISTYRLNRNKAPHWIWLVAMNDEYAFVNDPDIDDDQDSFDNSFVPISRLNLNKMMQYGKNQLKAAVILRSAIGS